MLRLILFAELRRERVVLAAQPNPVALPGCAGPGLAPRAASAPSPSGAPALPTLCAQGGGSGAGRGRGRYGRATMGSAPSPKAGGGAGMPRLGWCHRTSLHSAGKGLVSPGSGEGEQ
jgi:hypothetical protein